MFKKRGFIFFSFLLFFFAANSQDSTAISWDARSSKSTPGEYELIFEVHVKPGWQLYAPNQDLSGTSSMELTFADSSFSVKPPFTSEGRAVKHPVAIFDNAS